MELLVAVSNIVCWGTIVVAWIFLAVHGTRFRATAPRSRRAGSPTLLYAAAVVAAGLIAAVPQAFLAKHLYVDSPLLRAGGIAVLVASAAFAVWARVTLGTMWSIGPRVAGDRKLRTHGPYGWTRHPIYSGLLGMLIGSAVSGGMGRWLVLPIAGFVLFVVKIRDEERVLTSAFPDEYATYRRRVPALIPASSRWLRRPRNSSSGG